MLRPDTIKLLEENIGRTLSNINSSKFFFALLPRVMKIKTRINKWDLVKLKSFWTAKEAINKKTIHRVRENICKQSNQQRINLQNIQTAYTAQYKKNPIKKRVKNLNKHFFKKTYRCFKKHMKAYSTSLIIGEIQIKSTKRYHLT